MSLWQLSVLLLQCRNVMCQRSFCQMSFSQMSFWQIQFCHNAMCQKPFCQISLCKMSFRLMPFWQVFFFNCYSAKCHAKWQYVKTPFSQMPLCLKWSKAAWLEVEQIFQNFFPRHLRKFWHKSWLWLRQYCRKLRQRKVLYDWPGIIFPHKQTEDISLHVIIFNVDLSRVNC
jgi:hypothetical protein